MLLYLFVGRAGLRPTGTEDIDRPALSPTDSYSIGLPAARQDTPGLSDRSTPSYNALARGGGVTSDVTSQQGFHPMFTPFRPALHVRTSVRKPGFESVPNRTSAVRFMKEWALEYFEVPVE
jgi:hypothetical protein